MNILIKCILIKKSVHLVDTFFIEALYVTVFYVNLPNWPFPLFTCCYAVPIIYMLLWSEYNYRHALELSKVPRCLISEKTIL